MDYLNKDDKFYLEAALNLAKQAFEEDEVPVGAIIVSGNRIIGKGYNQVERLKDVTAHAEMIAITSACHYLGSKYLDDATLFVSLEPCMMCYTAAFWAKIPRIVYGAKDNKRGFTNYTDKRLYPNLKTVLNDGLPECGSIVKDFFIKKRNI